ncbi:MAG: glycoside hydrolase family 88 protein [Lachnospiraceae bacterium]|nr:glycoside hydrolase family 88 protein [Lachnospiraceae bacterium]
MKKENIAKIEKFIGDYYKDYSKVRFNKWNYEDGCILTAAINMYKATNDSLYKDFVVNYMSEYVEEDGSIRYYKYEDFNLDNIAPGRAIVFAYEQTGEERYRKAMDLLLSQLAKQPRIPEGNFWHKKIYPNQVWLDGLFMAQPFYMACDTRYGKKDHYIDICDQFKLVQEKMFNEEKGLYYHGFDSSKSIFWADKETGLSANFWLRSIAWFLMALVETMEEMDRKVYDNYQPLMEIYKNGVKGVLNYLDKDFNMFWQLVDLGGELEGNYLETSGSSMIAASILKACRYKVLLPEKYQPIGEKIIEAVIENKLVEKDGVLELTDNCSVAGLGPNPGRRD